MAETGRGAWSFEGMSNGSATRLYEHRKVSGWVMQGSQADRGPSYEAVNFGIQAIQTRISQLTGIVLVLDGVFGPKTASAARDAQSRLRLTADGVIGPRTTKAFWSGLLRDGAGGVTATVQCGLIQQESAQDPGAVGFFSPDDKGLVQINLSAHLDVAKSQAFDVGFAIPWMVRYLERAVTKYGKLEYAIASYNSPRSAAQWAQSGSPPNPAIAKYVSNIISGCP